MIILIILVTKTTARGNETSLLPLGPLALESKQFFPKELIRGQQLFEEDVMESKKVKKFEAKVECFNASCSSSTSFQKRCAIFIGSPPLCDVPCHLEGCKIEYHQNIMQWYKQVMVFNTRNHF